ncbi:ABC transporter ATP-binding protein, partial [Mycoplasmopsis synoviae]
MKHENKNTYHELKDSFTHHKKVSKWKQIENNYKSFLEKLRFAKKEFRLQDFIKNAKTEKVFGKDSVVAAEIEDIHLSFLNPDNPKEKNVVLRGASLKIYEGYV